VGIGLSPLVASPAISLEDLSEITDQVDEHVSLYQHRRSCAERLFTVMDTDGEGISCLHFRQLHCAMSDDPSTPEEATQQVFIKCGTKQRPPLLKEYMDLDGLTNFFDMVYSTLSRKEFDAAHLRGMELGSALTAQIMEQRATERRQQECLDWGRRMMTVLGVNKLDTKDFRELCRVCFPNMLLIAEQCTCTELLDNTEYIDAQGIAVFLQRAFGACEKEKFDAAVVLMMHHASASMESQMEEEAHRRLCEQWGGRLLAVLDVDGTGSIDPAVCSELFSLELNEQRGSEEMLFKPESLRHQDWIPDAGVHAEGIGAFLHAKFVALSEQELLARVTSLMERAASISNDILAQRKEENRLALRTSSTMVQLSESWAANPPSGMPASDTAVATNSNDCVIDK